MILVFDYGSQYTQLIAKRLRRLGYATEVWPGSSSADKVLAAQNSSTLATSPIKGIILSGSPASVGESVDPDPKLLELGLPILGLCFGYQFLATHLGGAVSAQSHREYGSATVRQTAAGKINPLTRTLSESSQVWMSHGDSVVSIPPGAELLLESDGKPSAFALPQLNLYGLQFHPEVHHSPEGDRILKAFASDICKLREDWNLTSVMDKVVDDLRTQLKGVDEVYCAVSGGVDSTVLAALLSKVTRVHALYVDHGFQRAYDLEDLKKNFSHFPNIKLQVIDAREDFWKELHGVSDPELKRKTIGRLFIETFYKNLSTVSREAAAQGQKTYLGQGTIYSDVIESAANDMAAAHKIKSHHNVGGLPSEHGFTLVEPLRRFFKDEVREIGALLGLDPDSLARHPFPGPGLSIRCVGALTPERIEIVRQADAILYRELVSRKLYEKTWQALCVLLPVSTVGVMGDGRTYESVIAIRAVSSIDAMTAEASELPWSDMKAISSRIVNEVRGVNRVVYDLTSKPPGTIEWE